MGRSSGRDALHGGIKVGSGRPQRAHWSNRRGADSGSWPATHSSRNELGEEDKEAAAASCACRGPSRGPAGCITWPSLPHMAPRSPRGRLLASALSSARHVATWSRDQSLSHPDCAGRSHDRCRGGGGGAGGGLGRRGHVGHLGQSAGPAAARAGARTRGAGLRERDTKPVGRGATGMAAGRRDAAGAAERAGPGSGLLRPSARRLPLRMPVRPMPGRAHLGTGPALTVGLVRQAAQLPPWWTESTSPEK